MKKKLFSVFVMAIVVASCIATLVACNPYKAASIGSGDSSAEVESNGGYVVKQGKYVYYINGYVGESADNTWNDSEDATIQQGIIRAEMVDGRLDMSTAKYVVRKAVYNSSTSGGIAIHGDWIYYASINTDKDRDGNESTTNTDFMRTKTDGSVTQLIRTIGTRSAQYMFTSSRVLYYYNNTIYYADFSNMSQTKATDSGKGVTAGVLASNVEGVVWSYDTDKLFYTQSAPSEDSYKSYNSLCMLDADGTPHTLATEETFVKDEGGAVNDQLNVFNYSLLNLYVEEDGDVTLYYTKSHTLSSTVTDGLYMARISDFEGTEKRLNTIASTTIVPLGYEDGALAYNSNSVYCLYDGSNAENPLQVTTTSQTIWKVDAEAGVVYFSATSSATSLSKISYKEAKDNATVIIEEGIKTDWLVLDFVGDDFYFFATDDSNSIHTINLKTFDKDAEDAESTYIGLPLETDEDED